MKLITARGQLMHNLPSNGSMAAVFADKTVIKPYLSENLTVGAENGSHLVLSGRTISLEESLHKLQSQGIKTKALNVSHAFHSPLMEPMLTEFRQVAEQISFHPPRLPLISNVTGAEIGEAIAKADYWVKHVLEPVKFVQSIQQLNAAQVNIYLEIGVKPILLSMGRHCLPDQNALWLPSLRPQSDDWQEMLTSLGKLYEHGVKINWQAVETDYGQRKLPLPTYPFQRQRYWFREQSWQMQPEVTVDLADWLYGVDWQPIDLPVVTPAADQLWLILGDRQEFAQQIASQFPRSQIVYLGGGCSFTAGQPWQVNPDQFSELFTALLTQFADTKIGGIIHCWSLDATLDNLDQAQWLSCYTALKLIQALHQQRLTIPCWFVTRHSQQVIPTETVSGLAQSSLWGLGQAIALEHPELWGGLIDLDESDTLPDFPVLCQQTKVQHLASRQGKLFAASLQPKSLPTQNIPQINPEVTYLITGGLGSLGRKLAQWLEQQGATQILLLSRRHWTAEAIATLQLPRSATVYTCDLANRKAVQTLFQRFPKITGIFHAAGVLADGLLQGQSWENFQTVFSPKIQGTWNLHQCSQSSSLDFFVLFSSAAAVMGSPGQGNYAAANAFMDAIAKDRQAQGLPALSINWGPWAAGGMATSLRNQAMTLINPDQGLSMFGRLLSQQGNIGVFQPDWQQLGQQFPKLRQSHYFQALLQEQPTQEQASVFVGLQRSPAPEKKQYLLGYLRQTIARILKLPMAQIQAQDNLLDLGMDSLMVMEAIAQLKQDLQLMLYPREIYERPRLDILAQYLMDEWLKTHDPQHGGTSSTPSVVTLPQSQKAPWRQPPEKNPQPIAFILSSPRSGSTLLRVMLAGHPALYSPPELHLLPFETMGDRQAELGLSHLGEGLQRALMDLEGMTAAESQAQIEQWVQENWAIADVYQYLQTRAAGRLLIDKSPSYGSDRHILDHSEILFSQAKYIHLVRHPYAVIESFGRLRMDKLLGATGDNPYGLAESIWTKSNQNILALAQVVQPGQYLQVIYEDLVRHPRRELLQICEFLGIDFDEALLNPYGGDRLTDGLHEQSMGVGDPNFLQHKQIDPELADKWRQITLPHPLKPATVELASKFHYELPQEPDHSIAVPTMTERRVQVRHLDYCLCEWGDRQQPLILLLHGILEQGASWQLIAPALAAQGYWVVAPDLRGHGKSAHAQSYSMLDFLADVDDLAKQLTDQPFTLVGHSMGSVISALYAGIRGDRLQRVCLVETIVPNEIDDAETANHLVTHLDYLAAPPQHPTFPDVAIAARRLRQVTPQLSQALSETLAERSTVPVADGVQWGWDAFLRTRAGIEFNGISRRRYLALLRDIQVPVTLIYGDRSEFNRPDDLAVIEGVLPGAIRHTVAGGHNLQFENPEAIAEILIESLMES
jgi:pimeloyl-ACP methyl ester carboxylesterase/malonyl CoA-acyl carrier protein transacylase